MRFLTIALLLLTTPAAPKPAPISAHNCYPPDGKGNARLVEALAIGIDNIEIDLGWDETGKRLTVGHEASPAPHTSYPTFEDYVRPLLDAPERPDRAPSVLTGRLEINISGVSAVS